MLRQTSTSPFMPPMPHVRILTLSLNKPQKVILIFGLFNEYVAILLYPKAVVGWERRMWKRRPREKSLSALEHLRIEIQVPRNLR